MRRTTLLFLIPLALALGCGKDDEYQPKKTQEVPVAKFAAGEEAKLVPLAVGNQWVYTMIRSGERSELTLKVESIQQTPDGKEATIGVYPSDSNTVVPTQTMVWRVTDTGVYQITTGTETVYDPPQLLIPFPPDEKADFEHEGTGGRPVGGPGEYQSTIKVLGAQPIDTDNGRMSGFAIHSITSWESEVGPAVASTMTWWSPGIGFVRQIQEVRTSEQTIKVLLKLKSHSFPRSSQ